MKKIILSGGVIVAFIGYCLHAQSEQAKANFTTPTTTSQPQADTTSAQPAAQTSTSQTATTAPTTNSQYKDGSYTGSEADAFYGFIQVKATVSGGKITDVTFLQYPNDRGESVRINQRAMPLLKQEAIQAQSSQVDGVSGATDTSQAFIESLTSALNQAKA